ncbi:hypothetical protein [Fulvivirga lutimaris]|uniref:hypothetical protein n=1 Tax=Fulvivirga lutimaris TaxID=1819566 RepID=UPI0012BB87A3|nr:hypothetical protein [Fulvivirga lutimaris]MTI39925.1 hypothetical protein [Fulvivirga lutimaris]
MIRYLLLGLPVTLVFIVFYTGFNDPELTDVRHLFFFTITTFIIYTYQISKNETLTRGARWRWYLWLFFVPSITALIYWFKHLNVDELEEN